MIKQCDNHNKPDVAATIGRRTEHRNPAQIELEQAIRALKQTYAARQAKQEAHRMLYSDAAELRRARTHYRNYTGQTMTTKVAGRTIPRDAGLVHLRPRQLSRRNSESTLRSVDRESISSMASIRSRMSNWVSKLFPGRSKNDKNNHTKKNQLGMPPTCQAKLVQHDTMTHANVQSSELLRRLSGNQLGPVWPPREYHPSPQMGYMYRNWSELPEDFFGENENFGKGKKGSKKKKGSEESEPNETTPTVVAVKEEMKRKPKKRKEINDEERAAEPEKQQDSGVGESRKPRSKEPTVLFPRQSESGILNENKPGTSYRVETESKSIPPTKPNEESTGPKTKTSTSADDQTQDHQKKKRRHSKKRLESKERPESAERDESTHGTGVDRQRSKEKHRKARPNRIVSDEDTIKQNNEHLSRNITGDAGRSHQRRHSKTRDLDDDHRDFATDSQEKRHTRHPRHSRKDSVDVSERSAKRSHRSRSSSRRNPELSSRYDLDEYKPQSRRHRSSRRSGSRQSRSGLENEISDDRFGDSRFRASDYRRRRHRTTRQSQRSYSGSEDDIDRASYRSRSRRDAQAEYRRCLRACHHKFKAHSVPSRLHRRRSSDESVEDSSSESGCDCKKSCCDSRASRSCCCACDSKAVSPRRCSNSRCSKPDDELVEVLSEMCSELENRLCEDAGRRDRRARCAVRQTGLGRYLSADTLAMLENCDRPIKSQRDYLPKRDYTEGCAGLPPRAPRRRESDGERERPQCPCTPSIRTAGAQNYLQPAPVVNLPQVYYSVPQPVPVPSVAVPPAQQPSVWYPNSVATQHPTVVTMRPNPVTVMAPHQVNPMPTVYNPFMMPQVSAPTIQSSMLYPSYSYCQRF